MSRDVLTAADLPLLRDGVILANAGHFPAEIDAEGLIGAGEVAASRQYADDLLTLELTDGRRVHLVSRGHMFNLAGPRPLAIRSNRWISCSRCRPAAWRRWPPAPSTRPVVVPVPAAIDTAVATSYLDRKYPPR